MLLCFGGCRKRYEYYSRPLADDFALGGGKLTDGATHLIISDVLKDP